MSSQPAEDYTRAGVAASMDGLSLTSTTPSLTSFKTLDIVDIDDSQSSSSMLLQGAATAPAAEMSSSDNDRAHHIYTDNEDCKTDSDRRELLCCPVCQQILYQPLTTPCKHTFCGVCMTKWYFGSPHIRIEPLCNISASERADMVKPCGLCRRQVRWHELFLDSQLQRDINHVFPLETATRHAEVQDLMRYKASDVTLYIGNTHTYVFEHMLSRKPNVHLWTFFVHTENTEDEKKYIDHVVVHLHPTFDPRTVILTEPPFELRRLGWGYFLIRVEVHWKEAFRQPSAMSEYFWHLDFHGEGDFEKHTLTLTTLVNPPANETTTHESLVNSMLPISPLTGVSTQLDPLPQNPGQLLTPDRYAPPTQAQYPIPMSEGEMQQEEGREQQQSEARITSDHIHGSQPAALPIEPEETSHSPEDVEHMTYLEPSSPNESGTASPDLMDMRSRVLSHSMSSTPYRRSRFLTTDSILSNSGQSIFSDADINMGAEERAEMERLLEVELSGVPSEDTTGGYTILEYEDGFYPNNDSDNEQSEHPSAHTGNGSPWGQAEE